jgi:hypothetical protein
MPLNAATCPHCRATLGLRTTFTLADLWDPRTTGPIRIRPEFLCYQCGRTLGYPANTALSFIALAILPLVVMGLLPELRIEWLPVVSFLLAPYLACLGITYSCFATPIPVER